MYLIAALDPPEKVIMDIEKLFANFMWVLLRGLLNGIVCPGVIFAAQLLITNLVLDLYTI